MLIDLASLSVQVENDPFRIRSLKKIERSDNIPLIG